MRTFLRRTLLVWSAVFMAATVWAQPQGLERVGPTSPANGFPTWYQDKTGLTLEFCSPQNQAELDGGWCLLLPGDTTVPEAFPGPFADEHFFFAADASIAGPGTVSAALVIGLEAAFAQGPVINGDQVVFARIRLRVDNLPATGAYTIYHPYGTDVIEGTANDRLFWTEDIGFDCRGAFDCALHGRIGPFLLPSTEPGGAELPAVAGPVAGKLYIASPDRLGPVTGSPVGQNYFRVVGPPGSGLDMQTSDFALMGRVFQGIMPGRVVVDRASYARDVGNPLGKVDVFATASPTTPTRLPGQAPAPVVLPLLEFFNGACTTDLNGRPVGPPADVLPTPMFGEGSRYYGQIKENAAINGAVCVRDNTARDVNGQIVPIYVGAPLRDMVTITQAQFDPANGGVLTVAAVSSDLYATRALSALNVGALGATGVASASVTVPPAKLQVTSTAGGHAEIDVTTKAGDVTGSLLPFAGNDNASMNEDGPQILIDVLLNDTVLGVPIQPADALVAIVADPRLGQASPTADGKIAYTPNLNAFGSDLLSYTVAVGGKVSSPAYVAIVINNVNDPPVAVDDVATGVGGLGISVPLLANDSDVDGAADLKNAVIVTAPAGIAYSVVAGVLTFSAGAGQHVFTYQAMDAAGALSAAASVTVTLSGQNETLNTLRSEYIQSKRRWRVEGTSSIVGAPDHTVYVMYADGVFANGTTAAGYLIGTAPVVAGAWALDFALAGTNDPRNPTNTTLFTTRPTQVVVISTLGGASPPRAINLR